MSEMQKVWGGFNACMFKCCLLTEYIIYTHTNTFYTVIYHGINCAILLPYSVRAVAISRNILEMENAKESPIVPHGVQPRFQQRKFEKSSGEAQPYVILM